MPERDFLGSLFDPGTKEAKGFARAGAEGVSTRVDNLTREVLSYFGVSSQPPGSETYANKVTDILTNRLKVMEKSFKLNNQLLEKELSEDPDISSLHRKWIELRLKASNTFADEAFRTLRDKADIRELACCMIRSLVQLDSQDLASVNENLRSTRRTLVVMRTMLALARETLRKGIKTSTFEFSFNFLKTIMEDVHDMWVGIYTALINQFFYTLTNKISRWMISKRIGLECFGFVRMWQYLMNLIITTYLPKLRAALYAGFLRASKSTYKSQSEILKLQNLNILDVLIRLIDTLIDAIELELVCGQSTYNTRTEATFAGDESSGGQAGTGGGTVSLTSNLSELSGTTNPATTSGTDIVENSLLEGVRQPPLDGSRTSIGQVPIDVARLFYAPTTEELERFLTRFLGVAPAEARNAARASAKKDCMDMLSEQDKNRVQELLAKLRI